MTKAIRQYLEGHTEDAILFFSKQKLEAAEDPHAKQIATNEVSELLASIDGDIMRESYIDEICKVVKWIKKPQLKKELGIVEAKKAEKDSMRKESFLDKLPRNQRSSITKFGFYSKEDGDRTGYYFRTGQGADGESNFHSITNFVMTPLFHKYDQDDNTRIVRINNGLMEPEVIELPSKALISVESFKTFLFERGPYFFDGSKIHLDKLNKFYLFEFPKAFELKTLGWQHEGFFAYYNIAFNGKLTHYNEAGLVKHKEQNFFSPASSDIYKNYRQDGDDDQYENDKYLKYQEAEIDFSEWADLMHKAYGEHAKAAVAWVLVCLFKDIVFKVDNNAPFLYSYGPSQSGKSKFHQSVSNLFFKEMPAFNLNSGTDFAFAQRMSRFKNCPIEFNEFNDDVVKNEWFEAIKGAYDGEGRERGRGMSKRRTETQKVNGLIMLAGQYLSTRDDNSVLSRSILRSFKKQMNRPESQTIAFNRLKELEKKGLSSILTDLLVIRPEVQEKYPKEFNSHMKSMSASIRRMGDQFNERVLRNYVSLLTMYDIVSKTFELPWKLNDYKEWIQNQIVDISQMISNTDVLVDFWKTLEALFERGELKEGAHFKIEEEQKVKYHHKGKETKFKEYTEPRKILYLRLSMVRDEFAKWKKQVGGTAMDLTSLTSYLKDRDYYIGYCDGTTFHRFKRSENGEVRRMAFSTSGHMFDYDQLGINLLRHDDDLTDNSPQGKTERNEAIENAKQLELDKPLGKSPFDNNAKF